MTQLLRDIFNDDFTRVADSADFHRRFFARALSLADLARVSETVRDSRVAIGGKTIPSAVSIKGNALGPPFVILAQLHGNEPAGLAGILLAMALAESGRLERDIIGVIGNPLAAAQYFEAWAAAPQARQETRDAYRCGIDAEGGLLPDMNRIPVDFLQRPPSDPHTKRAQELYRLAGNAMGILDIHSARGNMLCITDHKHDRELRHSPIRSVLTGLAEAISANASARMTVQTFKTIAGALPNILTQTGIEAGRHESPESPHYAASFTLSLLHTLGLTAVAPFYAQENGLFTRYAVRPRLTYGELPHPDTLRAEDHVYMAKTCHALASLPRRCDTVIVRRADGSYNLQTVAAFIEKPEGKMEFAVYQYDEMEPIAAGDVVAVALPSGTAFRTPAAFAGIFLSKSAALYDKDPAVGPWPVAADKIGSTKFCYPCTVSEMAVSF